MPLVDLVFVVLVYRNPHDLVGFLDSLAAVSASYRVVVVNSYYDEPTRAACEQLCADRDCDFLNVENKGYGNGNNRGIEYASAHYQFKFLVVCNPDVVVRQFPAEFLKNEGCCAVFGPSVKTLSGKRQNPCMVIYSPLRERLMMHYACRPGNATPFYLAVAINKLERIVFNLLFGNREKRVYSLHGCFLIFSAPAIERIGTPFDPEMFLFREEDYLARLARQLGIPMIYCPGIRVLHREDGSVRFMNEGVKVHTVESLRRYFGIK